MVDKLGNYAFTDKTRHRCKSYRSHVICDLAIACRVQNSSDSIVPMSGKLWLCINCSCSWKKNNDTNLFLYTNNNPRHILMKKHPLSMESILSTWEFYEQKYTTRLWFIIGSWCEFAPNKSQTITWTNDDTIQWRIYAWSGPCLTTVAWRCRKSFSQWGRNFHWKLRCRWLEFVPQSQIVVVRQGPGPS